MHHRFSLSFPSCLICSSHSNCRTCAARWQEDLSALPEIRSITITADPLCMEVQSPLSEEDLIDFLEDRGLLIQG